MSNGPASEDSSPHDATLDLVIQTLMEHEQKMAQLIERLDEIKPQFENAKKLSRRFEEIDASLSNLESEIKRLISNIKTN